MNQYSYQYFNEYFNTKLINGGASFRWSFGPLSAWGSIESTTLLTAHPSLLKKLTLVVALFLSMQELVKLVLLVEHVVLLLLLIDQLVVQMLLFDC